MSSLGLFIQLLTAILVFLLGIGGTAFAWYMKNHVISEVEKNSQFRRYAEGTTHHSDDGALGELELLVEELDDLNQQMNDQHGEVSRKVDYVITYCQRIAESVEADIEEPDQHWADSGDD